MISQFFVLSPRGDTIISRDFRGDLPKTTAEIFFRDVKNFKGTGHEAPPIFNLDGINYFYHKKNGLFFLACSRTNVSPSFVMELLHRFFKIFKDYCGILTEESIRKNFVLIYELIDEMMDNGFPQGTSTESLKSFVFNKPVLVQAQSALAQSIKKGMSSKTTPSTSVDKPIAMSRQRGKKQKNEIFVDIFERISVTFNANGFALNSEIDGTIQMKSYLSGNPELKLALNEDLVVGNTGSSPGYNVVTLDDCNFHGCVNTDQFESDRCLSFYPPDGEFSLLNYKITSDFRSPFRIFPFFELTTPFKVELVVKIRADIPEQNHGGNVLIQFPVPKSTQNVSLDMGVGVTGQFCEYNQKEKKVIWKIKKFQGGSEQQLKCKVTFGQQHTASVRKEFGPISMNFEIPMYNCSNLQVRYLRIMETHKKYNPFRWVRYVTRSQSYICRL